MACHAGLTFSESRSPFVRPFREKEAADRSKKQFQTGNSDQLTAWTAYKLVTFAVFRPKMLIKCMYNVKCTFVH